MNWTEWVFEEKKNIQTNKHAFFQGSHSVCVGEELEGRVVHGGDSVVCVCGFVGVLMRFV